MPMTVIGGRMIHVDRDGYLTEVGEWDDELAERLAAAAEIELTEAHWNVLSLVREAYFADGRVPDLHRVSGDCGIPAPLLREMFPGDPLWMIVHLAGLPGPRR